MNDIQKKLVDRGIGPGTYEFHIAGQIDSNRSSGNNDYKGSSFQEDQGAHDLQVALEARLEENRLHLQAINASSDPNNEYLSIPFRVRIKELGEQLDSLKSQQPQEKGQE